MAIKTVVTIQHTSGLKRSRRASIMLETIVVLPVLLILLLAVVQFGIFFSNLQQLTLTARECAKIASETPSLPISNGQAVPDEIIDSINQRFGDAGIKVCQVMLVHNCGENNNIVELSSGNNEGLVTPTMARPDDNFVQVTVCCELSELMPNSLASFGLDIRGKYVQRTTTYRYEL